jgi:hypothetical protein
VFALEALLQLRQLCRAPCHVPFQMHVFNFDASILPVNLTSPHGGRDQIILPGLFQKFDLAPLCIELFPDGRYSLFLFLLGFHCRLGQLVPGF